MAYLHFILGPHQFLLLDEIVLEISQLRFHFHHTRVLCKMNYVIIIDIEII